MGLQQSQRLLVFLKCITASPGAHLRGSTVLIGILGFNQLIPRLTPRYRCASTLIRNDVLYSIGKPPVEIMSNTINRVRSIQVPAVATKSCLMNVYVISISISTLPGSAGHQQLHANIRNIHVHFYTNILSPNLGHITLCLKHICNYAPP